MRNIALTVALCVVVAFYDAEATKLRRSGVGTLSPDAVATLPSRSQCASATQWAGMSTSHKVFCCCSARLVGWQLGLEPDIACTGPYRCPAKHLSHPIEQQVAKANGVDGAAISTASSRFASTKADLCPDQEACVEKIKGAIKGVQDPGWSDWGERFGVALCLGSTRAERKQTRLNEMKVGHPTSDSDASSSVVSTQKDPKEAVCRLSKEKRDALYACSTVGCEAGVDICEDKSCEEDEPPKDEEPPPAPPADQWYNTPPDWWNPAPPEFGSPAPTIMELPM